MEIGKISDYNVLTENEVFFVELIKKYLSEVKQENDEKIKTILENITTKNGEVDGSYGSGKKPKTGVKYAYVIKIPKNIFKKEQKEQIIKSIDYTAIGNLEIAFYAGLAPSISKALIKYIEKDKKAFWKRLKRLNNEYNWTVEVQYRVGNGTNSVNQKSVHVFTCNWEKEEEFFNYVNLEQIMFRQKTKTAKTEIEKCIMQLMDNNIIIGLNNKECKQKIEIIKSQNYVCSAWCINLTYQLKKIHIIDNNNKKEVENLFREKTKEGLEVFELGDIYKECFIQSHE